MSSETIISEEQFANLQLSLSVLAHVNSRVYRSNSSAQSKSVTGELLANMSDAAEQNGNLHHLELAIGGRRIQLLFTVDPSASEESSTQQVLGPSTSVRFDKSVTAAEIHDYLEQAFKDYNSLGKLGRSLLVPLLQTDLTVFAREEPINSGGLALRHLLDTLIARVCGVETDSIIPRAEWRAEQYLHLRYRQGIAHKDLAEPTGFSERHLQRIRQKQIRQAVELCI